MTKKISIIGCGWLGLPLAKVLVGAGHSVKGSTTALEKAPLLRSAGILPFVVSISKEGITGDIAGCLKDSELLIINIPPGLRKNPDADFVKQMQLLSNAIEQSEIKKILYVGSTSVYDEDIAMPVITEESTMNAESSTAKQLIAAEQIFKTHPKFETTILRFGGLIGSDRNPAKFLSGKSNIQSPEAPVNLIHQEDCIDIITSIIKNNCWNTSFNAAAPQHPSRQMYYTALCKTQNLPLPHFDYSTPNKGKIISSEKLERVLNYEYQHQL